MGGTEPWPGSCLTIGSTTSPATSNPSPKALLARNSRRQSAVSLHGRQASRGAGFPSCLHSRASLRAALPHPAAPVQHQPPSFPKPAVARPSPRRTLEALPSPILSGMSRLRYAARHCGGALGPPPSPRARGGYQRGALGGVAGRKMPFVLPIRYADRTYPVPTPPDTAR